MNFSSMDYFVMVARERSFSRAAERLHITQQTLSAHIAKLEQELGKVPRVEDFQTDPQVRLFVAQIQAAGAGKQAQCPDGRDVVVCNPLSQRFFLIHSISSLERLWDSLSNLIPLCFLKVSGRFHHHQQKLYTSGTAKWMLKQGVGLVSQRISSPMDSALMRN